MLRLLSRVFPNRSLQLIQSRNVIRKSRSTEEKSFDSFQEAFDYISRQKSPNKRTSKSDQQTPPIKKLDHNSKREKVNPSPDKEATPVEGAVFSAKSVADEAGFSYDSRDRERVRVYTDGSCKMVPHAKGGARRAGIGVYWGPHHALNVSDKYEGVQTNNRAEIAAATRAVRVASAHGIRKLTVVTDSEFLVNCMSGWLATWKRNQWMLPGNGGNGQGKKPVRCRDELERLDQALTQSRIDVRWEHVAGHSDDVGNRQADSLATAGADKWLADP